MSIIVLIWYTASFLCSLRCTIMLVFLLEMDPVKARHAKLVNDLSDHVIIDSPEYKSFLTAILSLEGIARGNLSRKDKSVQEVLDLMQTKGHLAPGNYQTLIKCLEDGGHNDCVDIVKKADGDIKRIQKGLSLLI